MKSHLLLVVLLGVALVFASGRTAGQNKPTQLPGAKGPLYEKVGQLNGGVEVLTADVSHDAKDLHLDPANAPKSRSLPTGTGSSFKVAVVLNKTPAADCAIEIHGGSGKVPFFHAQATSTDKASGQCIMIFTGQGKDRLADGPYQAKLKTSGEVFLLVNWHIGEPSK